MTRLFEVHAFLSVQNIRNILQRAVEFVHHIWKYAWIIPYWYIPSGNTSLLASTDQLTQGVAYESGPRDRGGGSLNALIYGDVTSCNMALNDIVWKLEARPPRVVLNVHRQTSPSKCEMYQETLTFSGASLATKMRVETEFAVRYSWNPIEAQK